MRHSRSLIWSLLIVLLATGPLLAQREDDSGRASKNGMASATLDGVAVTLEFGRPNVNGRDVWGGLVPWGEVWRTGADEATTITFDKDVEVEGQPLAAGTYALFTIPNEGSWTVIFNKTAKQWGSFRYDAEQDALRIEVQSKDMDFEESMNFEFHDNWVMLRWASLGVPFQVEAAG